MLAQRTLEQWSAGAPEHVAVGLEAALLGVAEPEARARVVETLGLVPARRRRPAAAASIAGDAGEDRAGAQCRRRRARSAPG